MKIVLNDDLDNSPLGLHLGSRFLKTAGPWSAHGAPLSFAH